ncbi:NnrU family protein [Frigidibacter sp. ROC022]|uniref:NnrU family protein n=1 Tax=Frigidibacter sp. ROC022 TaxID=2971796 RepID=UPI00215A412B|nr:NnrU family protein [Frigidibacter sp. ROC022]MCR8724056.1 NnrU family protein [Frigidibacter sp. ROC022]
MIWIVIGVALWSGAHVFKRLVPNVRRGMGDAAKGMVAAASLLAIVLMVIGYRMADPDYLWQLGGWARHANNTLMVLAVILFGASHSKSHVRGWLRHPMLTSVILWAVAHLLVNGDVPSLVLFGGLGLWAVAEIVLINRAEPKWVRPKGNARGDLMLLAISVVVFAVISALHIWLGPNPFTGA